MTSLILGEFVTTKATREARRATGTCTRCGRSPAMPGLTECEGCRVSGRERALKRFEKCKANGLCTICGMVPPMLGYNDCEVCLAIGREHERRDRATLIADGFCTRCSNAPTMSGHVECEDCREDARKQAVERRRYRKNIGVCTVCGILPPESEYTKCATCRNKSRSVKAWLNELLTRSQKASRTDPTWDNKRENNLDINLLMALYEEQHGICPVSRYKMTTKIRNPYSISIDRIDSNFGYIKGNVVLVCKFVNLGRGKYCSLDKFRTVLRPVSARKRYVARYLEWHNCCAG